MEREHTSIPNCLARSPSLLLTSERYVAMAERTKIHFAPIADEPLLESSDGPLFAKQHAFFTLYGICGDGTSHLLRYDVDRA
jgi:hypothetical protein